MSEQEVQKAGKPEEDQDQPQEIGPDAHMEEAKGADEQAPESSKSVEPAVETKKTETTESPAHGAGKQQGAATEGAVGITCFVCPNRPGFQGTIKQRFRDFIVREIGLNGEATYLTSQNSTSMEEEEEAEEVQEQDKIPKGLDALEALTNREVREKVEKLIKAENIGAETSSAESGDNEPFVCLPVIDDKQKRKEVHQCVRQYFGPDFISDTVSQKSETHEKNTPLSTIRIIRADAAVSASNERNTGKRVARGDLRGDAKQKRPRVIDRWPANKPPYASFTLYKENMEAGALVAHLSFHLGIPSANIGFAGNKDKRGVTVQKMTVCRRKPDAVVQAVKTPTRGRNSNYVVAVGDFEFTDKPLALGDQLGNRFEITMRNVKLAESDAVPGRGTTGDSVEARLAIEENIRLWAEHGFLNYFGMQRFGTYSTSTHSIGACVLRGDFKTAVKLLFEPSGNGDTFEAAAKTFTETCQASKTLLNSRGSTGAIRSIVQHIDKDRQKRKISDPMPLEALDNRTLQGAFSRIPHHLRQLYIHAYQAYVFNKLVTKRVESYGATKVVEGDLVLKQGPGMKYDEASIQVATKEDVEAGKWSMEDVVLPVPGTKTTLFPAHEAGKEAIDTIMAADGVYLDVMRTEAGKVAPQGTFRHMLVKPSNVTHRWLYYTDSDANADFLQTDLERLQGEPDPEVRFSEANAPLDASNAALVLRFDLRTSCYATMGLRELMKTATDREAVINAPAMTPKVVESQKTEEN